jgi:hypothetical protein
VGTWHYLNRRERALYVLGWAMIIGGSLAQVALLVYL